MCLQLGVSYKICKEIRHPLLQGGPQTKTGPWARFVFHRRYPTLMWSLSFSPRRHASVAPRTPAGETRKRKAKSDERERRRLRHQHRWHAYSRCRVAAAIDHQIVDGDSRRPIDEIQKVSACQIECSTGTDGLRIIWIYAGRDRYP